MKPRQAGGHDAWIEENMISSNCSFLKFAAGTAISPQMTKEP